VWWEGDIARSSRPHEGGFAKREAKDELSKKRRENKNDKRERRTAVASNLTLHHLQTRSKHGLDRTCAVYIRSAKSYLR
jgi:hypothetical protein